MAKVGYDMYLTLLEKAVKLQREGKDKNDTHEVENDVNLNLNVSAYISDSYIKDPIQKITMYQKISEIKNKDMMMDVIDELLDRYGKIPKDTENLIKIVEIRNLCKKLGVTKLSQYGRILSIEPNNLKISLTNFSNSDILIAVQNELEKMLKRNGEI